MFDASAWGQGLLIVGLVYYGLFVLFGGFVYGLVVSLVYDIQKAFSSALLASLIGSSLLHLRWLSGWLWCLYPNVECAGNAVETASSIILIYIAAVVISIPVGMGGMFLGIFIRYIAGVIAGTYKSRH